MALPPAALCHRAYPLPLPLTLLLPSQPATVVVCSLKAIAPAVPLSPRPLKVVSWNTGPAGRVGASIVEKLLEAGVAAPPPRGFGVILLQELPGQWSHPMGEDEVAEFLKPVSPSY